MAMYNLIEYSDNYSKTFRSLWRYYRDGPSLTDAGAIANFHAANKTASFKFQQKITGKTGNAHGIKNAEIIVSLKTQVFYRELLKCLELTVKLISF